MDRRTFLRGLLTVAAVSIAPIDNLSVGLPKIVGDGIHDDTAGILAAINGKPFSADGLVVRGQSAVQFGAGTFRMTAPMRFETSAVAVRGAEVGATKILADHDGVYVWFSEVRDVVVSSFWFDRTEAHKGASGLVWT